MSKQIDALRLALDALRVARESVSEWSSYASDYFKDKYELDGDFEAIDSSIEVIEAVLAEQGCDYCNHPQYAGTKCKNCGREQSAQQEPKIGCVNHDCDKCKAQQQEPVGAVYRYGKDSSGKPWHGTLWTASGLDLPDGTLIYTSPPAQRKPLTDDPLQGAVDWLLEADGEYFCTATVQRTLRIGYNRAKRLCDTAKERAAHGIKGDA